jgi:Raf kinase inhibitor-like YbhB/YbcL family protein
MEVTSPAFVQEQIIPKKYTCEGENISPPLVFENSPAGTVCFAIIVEDPDAPKGVYDHWIVWNIPGEQKQLPEKAKVPNQGVNHYGELRYRGPCPPPGNPHHYRFKVYALDRLLELSDGATKSQLEAAMKGHILAQGELVGIYQR